jgi:hypothetical protein
MPINGRNITLDPAMHRDPIPLPVRRVASTLPCGFRTVWVDGKGEPGTPIDEVALTMGGRYLILSIELRDGSRIEEIVDMVDFTDQWMKNAIAAGPTPAG